MAPGSRRPDVAELSHRIWEHLRGRAESVPGEFPPDTRDDVTGWRWEGAVASLIREAIPDITDSDLRRAREYLSACGMVVHVRGHQRGAGQPQWFIRSGWHQGPGGHVHVVATHPLGQPEAATPAACNEPQELAGQPRQDIATTLQALMRHVSELHSDNDRLREDNDRLREDNDRLCAEIERLRELMRDTGGEIARRASQLLADAEDQPLPRSKPPPPELHAVLGRDPALPAGRGPPAARLARPITDPGAQAEALTGVAIAAAQAGNLCAATRMVDVADRLPGLHPQSATALTRGHYLTSCGLARLRREP